MLANSAQDTPRFPPILLLIHLHSSPFNLFDRFLEDHVVTDLLGHLVHISHPSMQF